MSISAPQIGQLPPTRSSRNALWSGMSCSLLINVRDQQ
jgi:hypothetical protein